MRLASAAGVAVLFAGHAAARAAPGYCAVVVDQHKVPVRGATVWVMHDAGNTSTGRGCATTDGAGRFCLSPDDDGECDTGTVQVSVDEAHGGQCAGDVTLAAGARPSRITMTVDDRPLAELEGHVVDEQGRGVAGATVEHRTLRPNGVECSFTGDVPAVTGANGAFKVKTRRGDVGLAVEASGFAVRGVTVHNPSRGNTIVLDAGASWHGAVTAPDGRTLVRARLELIGGSAQPMVDGKFAVEHIAAGEHLMTLHVENDPLLGTRDEWRSITIGAREAKVDNASFSAGLDLAGTTGTIDRCVWAYPEALDHAGAPMPATGMHVTVMPAANGHFAFHHLPAGRWVVRTCKGFQVVIAAAGRTDLVLPPEHP